MDSGRRNGSQGVDDRVARDRAVEPRGATGGAAGDPASARWFASGLFAAATAIGLALVVAGLPLPEPLPVLVLAVFLLVAINRFTFFPTEIALTAEAAVLATAIVAFRHDSAFVGPWCVAFLAGPLDLLHWRQRSFVRMAFNAGNRMLATLAGAASFGILLDSNTLGTGAVRFGAAVLGAALAYASVDCAITVVLVRLQTGESWLGAARLELPLDALGVPLAVVGGVAGYLATEVGWWAAALVLFPVSFAPALLLVGTRRIAWPSVRAAAVSRSLRVAFSVVALSALVIGAFAQLTALPPPGVLAGLVVLALVAGLELRVDARGPVSPMVATLVVAAVVVGDHAALGGAVVVAVLATGTAWISQGRGWWAPLLAAGAATASAIVFDARPSRAGALAAALVFELVVVSRMRRIVWTMPLVCSAIALAYGWDAIGAPGALVFGAGALALAAATAAWGAPPWASRALGPSAARYSTGTHRAMVWCTAALSLGLAIAAVDRVSDRAVLIPLAEAAGAGVVAMAMVGVRQWRFAPRRRALDALLLLGCSLAILLAYPPVADTGDPWSVAILGGALAVAASVAWPVARRADAAARAPVAVDDAGVAVR